MVSKKTTTPILSVNKISATYNTSTAVLHNISFECTQGEVTCILGPNGSGKSTLMAAIAGIHVPSLQVTSPHNKESVLYKDIPIATLSPIERAKKISFLPQNEQYIWSYTVKDCVLMGRFAHTAITGNASTLDYAIVDEKMNMLNIEHLAHKSIHQISGGELQRVYLARSLAQESPLMLLDEPFSHLDIYQQFRLLSFLKELCAQHNKSAIITIHDINTAALFADSVILLSQGNIIAKGSVEDIFTTTHLSTTFGCDFKIYRHPFLDKPQVFPVI